MKNQTSGVKNQSDGVDHHLIAEQLRQLSRIYVNSQQYRIRYSNLLGITKERDFGGKFQYVDDDTLKQGITEKFSSFLDIEHAITKKIEKLLKQHPWTPWFRTIKGVGPIIMASFIGEIDGARYASIKKGKKATKSDLLGYGRVFEGTSHFWAYAGYGVQDGEAEKRKSGEKSSWNKYLKLTCYKFGESFIKLGGPYREIYDRRKEYELTLHPEKVDSGRKTKEGKKIILFTKMHIHRRAMRYAIKKFLSNVYHEFIETN